MKKIVLIALSFVLVTNGSIVLIEMRDPSTIYVGKDESKIVLVSPSIDLPAGSHVLFTWRSYIEPYGGNRSYVYADLMKNGEHIDEYARIGFEPFDVDFTISMYGVHQYEVLEDETSEFALRLSQSSSANQTCAYFGHTMLQIRIDFPDTQAACNEQPDDDDRVPMQSILTSQAYVTIPNVQDLYTAAGTKVDAVDGNRIELRALPVGTYIATTATGSVKIVKIR